MSNNYEATEATRIADEVREPVVDGCIWTVPRIITIKIDKPYEERLGEEEQW